MRKILLIIFAAALSVANLFAQTLYSHEGTVKQAYNFWVYVPETYQEDKAELPLVVFLHGKSLCGNDLSRVRRYGPLSALQYGRNINALILAPQSPGESWKPEKVNRLIDWTFENFKVDTNRVYVIGMSMGGFGTLDYVGTYPKRVSAAIAMCGGTTLKDCSKMKDVPLWIIHGTEDRAVPVSASDQVHSEILKAGAVNQTHYDRLDSVNHAMLARMFYLNQTYEWLFLHTGKGKQRVIQKTFDVREALPSAYKGLKSNSRKIEVVNGKELSKPASNEKTTAASTKPVQKDTIKTVAKAEPEPVVKDNSTEKVAQEKATQEKLAQEKAAQEKAAQEKAAQEQAEREAAAKLAAQKKAQAEAAKKKAAEDAKKKAAEEAKKKAAEEARKKAAEEAKKKAEAAKWHVVKSGESQWSIAHKYGITVDQLRKMNKLTDKSVIQPGQKLRIKY